MVVKNFKSIPVSKDDDFIYDYLINLFNQIKLVQSGQALDSTLRRHSKLKNYCISKQSSRIDYVENAFFNDDGTLIVELLGALKTQI